MNSFKKIIAMVIALCLLLALLAGCAAKEDTSKQQTPTEPAAQNTETVTEPAAQNTEVASEPTDEPAAPTEQPAAEDVAMAPASLNLTGIVSEIGEGYFVLDIDENTRYQVNYGETTLSNIAVSDIVVGVRLTVTYDGKETRSIPAQIFADTIDVCSVIGTVAEITEQGFILVVSDSLSYEVLPQPDSLPAVLPALESGMTVTVLYDGKETRSIPAQITGLKVIVPVITGTIDSIEDNAYLITDEATGNQVLVTVPDIAAFAVGERVSAIYNGVMTLSLPARVNATHVFAAK